MSSRRGPAQEHVLQGTAHRRVVRVGDTVRRPLTPWSRSVHELLLHLESEGYPFSPRFLGIDDQRREVLSFIRGTSGSDGYVEGLERGGDSWANVVSEPGLRRFAGFLRGYHDAVAGYRPPESACWVTGSGAGGPGDVICHGDYGPWNVIWEREAPAALHSARRPTRPVGAIPPDTRHLHSRLPPPSGVDQPLSAANFEADSYGRCNTPC